MRTARTLYRLLGPIDKAALILAAALLTGAVVNTIGRLT